jgi:hypothetical protein
MQATFARPFFAGQIPTLDDLPSLTSHVGVVDGGQRVVESLVLTEASPGRTATSLPDSSGRLTQGSLGCPSSLGGVW